MPLSVEYHYDDFFAGVADEYNGCIVIAFLYSWPISKSESHKSNRNHSQPFDIGKVFRQGYILSPHLFSIYTEQLMKEADIEEMGIRIGERNLTDLRYADDTALLVDNITST